MHELTEADIPALSRGCAVLGTGGGGAVDTAIPIAVEALRAAGPVPLVRLAALAPDALILPMAGIGAPTVSHEMPFGREQPLWLRAEVERITGRPVAAVMPLEIGGSNGVEPVAWAAQLGLPLLDADGVGRAFPEVQMISMNVAGLRSEFAVMVDVVGNVSTMRSVDAGWAERQARAMCVAAGSSALMANYVMDAATARGAVIEGSISAAVEIGRAGLGGGDPIVTLSAVLGARVLLEGKVVDVEHRTGGGFVRGSVAIEGTGDWADRMLRVEIQNENLVALEDGVVLATVPDLISVLDSQTGDAISTETMRYGQRVSVLAWPCDPLWRTGRGLAVAGPQAFGYEIAYRPVEALASVR